MKIFLRILACLLISSTTFCQTDVQADVPPRPPGNQPEYVIQLMITSGSLEGRESKLINGLGDAAAVAVTKVIAGKNLDAQKTDMILVILTGAFSDPGGVRIVADRQPRAAVFVLRYLDLCTADPELKKRIADTRHYIEGQYFKFTQGSSTRKWEDRRTFPDRQRLERMEGKMNLRYENPYHG